MRILKSRSMYRPPKALSNSTLTLCLSKSHASAMRWPRSPWALLGLLLLIHVVASDPSCRHTACMKRLDVSSWPVNTTDGTPARKNVFCRSSLSGVSRSTAVASEALQALCNGQWEYFSNSELDAFMASRFVNHSTPLEASAAAHPPSTERNTPWLLADIVLSSTKTQRRADSMRRVVGEAQLDLLLCSNPSCTVLVDLLKVETKAGSLWSVATSGIAASAFQTSVGTIGGLRPNRLNERRDLLPLDLVDSGGEDFKTRMKCCGLPRQPPESFTAAPVPEASHCMCCHTARRPGYHPSQPNSRSLHGFLC